MNEFRYVALDDHGHEVVGALQAESRSAALSRLKGMGMYPMTLEAGGGGAAGGGAVAAVAGGHGLPEAGAAVRKSPSLFTRRVSSSDLALLTRQLASLFNAGLNMARCLSTLIDHCDNPTLVTALDEVRQAVQAGSSLWEALGEHPKIFSELYVNLVRAGEASGQLGKVLERLADSLEA